MTYQNQTQNRGHSSPGGNQSLPQNNRFKLVGKVTKIENKKTRKDTPFLELSLLVETDVTFVIGYFGKNPIQTGKTYEAIGSLSQRTGTNCIFTDLVKVEVNSVDW